MDRREEVSGTADLREDGESREDRNDSRNLSQHIDGLLHFDTSIRGTPERSRG